MGRISTRTYHPPNTAHLNGPVITQHADGSISVVKRPPTWTSIQARYSRLHQVAPRDQWTEIKDRPYNRPP